MIYSSPLTGTGGALPSIPVKDEGSPVVNAVALDFVGGGVAVTDGGSGLATVTIPGGGGGNPLLEGFDASCPDDYADPFLAAQAGKYRVRVTDDITCTTKLDLSGIPRLLIWIDTGKTLTVSEEDEWQAPVADFASLPVGRTLNDRRFAQDTGQPYYWDGAAWQDYTSAITAFVTGTGGLGKKNETIVFDGPGTLKKTFANSLETMFSACRAVVQCSYVRLENPNANPTRGWCDGTTDFVVGGGPEVTFGSWSGKYFAGSGAGLALTGAVAVTLDNCLILGDSGAAEGIYASTLLYRNNPIVATISGDKACSVEQISGTGDCWFTDGAGPPTNWNFELRVGGHGELSGLAAYDSGMKIDGYLAATCNSYTTSLWAPAGSGTIEIRGGCYDLTGFSGTILGTPRVHTTIGNNNYVPYRYDTINTTGGGNTWHTTEPVPEDGYYRFEMSANPNNTNPNSNTKIQLLTVGALKTFNGSTVTTLFAAAGSLVAEWDKGSAIGTQEEGKLVSAPVLLARGDRIDDQVNSGSGCKFYTDLGGMDTCFGLPTWIKIKSA